MNILFYSCLFLLLNGHIAMGQAVSAGVLGGVRATNDFNGTLSSESKRYIVGPTLDIRLPKRFSVEVDALYQRFGFSGFQFQGNDLASVRERTNSWEFPVILKYHFPARLARPFVGIGYSPRIVNGEDISSGVHSLLFDYFNQHSVTNYPVTQGVVVSGGVSLGAGHFRFTPEVRYTHWNAPYLNQFDSLPCCSGSNQNEVSVLLGISWK
jgi:hypothetical protein